MLGNLFAPMAVLGWQEASSFALAIDPVIAASRKNAKTVAMTVNNEESLHRAPSTQTELVMALWGCLLGVGLLDTAAEPSELMA